jgi:integrase
VIVTACDKAKVPRWHPHQLRHKAATWLRKEFGLDVARVVLGHRSPTITEQYAEIEFSKAQEIMGRVG